MPTKLLEFLEGLSDEDKRDIRVWVYGSNNRTVANELLDAVLDEGVEDPDDDCDMAYQQSVDEEEEERG